jgi:glycosyltransferase involved in cell wall biosynthesis
MNLSISAPINATGYGLASLHLIKQLSNTTNISYFPIGGISVSSQDEYNLISRLLDNSNNFDINAPYLKIWHQFDLATRIGKGKYFAFPFFELDTLNDREKLHLSVPDEIIVTSQWAKEVIYNNGITSKVNVVPLGVDHSIFNYNIPKIQNLDKYVFLTIGKWEIRKSHEILPDIFKTAFPNQQDVELIVLASEHSSYSSQDEIKAWKKLYGNDPRIKIIPGVNSQQDIANIIANSDCGLYISKAEGWNLELLETMAMNKPVIATNYSSHTEYCNKDNCLLVDINDKELAYDGKVFNNQGYWAKIGEKEIDQTIEYMRYLYNNRIQSNNSGLQTSKKYSWTNSANILSRCISI